ncbi:MAG: hypothetical protein ACREFJ_00045 [Acetobacteraceae bacterium]
MALGDWICGLAERGVTVSAWSGAGLFSGTSTITLTVPHGTLQTFSLHKGEIKPGQAMLVGFVMKDANQETQLSVEQWAAFAGGIESDIPMNKADCEQRFANAEPGKIAPTDKPYWLQCGLELAGLGDRGR